MQISVPRKTFLLGEYAVLQKGPAIVVCTEPFFTLTAEKLEEGNQTIAIPFHLQSPAGKFINDHLETFQSWQFSWKSPYSEGGFGGSTAEFLACYRWHYGENISIEHLYKTYLSYAYNGMGIPPSGTDLIAQTQKDIVYVHGIKQPISFSWPFPHLVLLLLKTPYKLPTHEHLATLKNLPDLSVLCRLTQCGYQALQENNQKEFIKIINEYAENLAKLGFTAEPTQDLISLLKKEPACLAVKGCGALGADVIAVIVHAEEKQHISRLFTQLTIDRQIHF